MNSKRRKNGVFVFGVMSVVGMLLTACTACLGDSKPESYTEVNDALEVPSVHSEVPQPSEPEYPWSADGPYIPELGPFNRSSPDFVQFNPCTGLPEQMRHAVGLQNQEALPDTSDADGICAYKASFENDSGFFVIKGGRFGFDDFLASDGESWWGKHTESGPILIYLDPFLPEFGCRAIVETAGGTLEVSAEAYVENPEELELCNEAEMKLIELLRADGKN